MDGVIVDTEPVHRYAYFQFEELNSCNGGNVHFIYGFFLLAIHFKN
jgi:hypothetical protein